MSILYITDKDFSVSMLKEAMEAVTLLEISVEVMSFDEVNVLLQNAESNFGVDGIKTDFTDFETKTKVMTTFGFDKDYHQDLLLSTAEIGDGIIIVNDINGEVKFMFVQIDPNDLYGIDDC